MLYFGFLHKMTNHVHKTSTKCISIDYTYLMLETKNIHQNWMQRLPFFYGWIILIVCSIGLFTSGPGQTYSVSIFLEPMRNDLNLGLTKIAGLYTLGSLIAASSMFLIGRLIDKYGARVLLTIIPILFALATIWMSNVNTAIHLLIGFAMIRILGQGSLSLIPTTLVSIWFVKHRGRAIALNSLGITVSQAVFPPLIHYLIKEYGWRNAWLVLGSIIISVLLLPALFFIRRTPESIGLYPDGDNSVNIEQNLNNKNDWSLKSALKTRTMWLLMFAGSSQSLIGTALIFLQVSIFESKGLSTGLAASVFAISAPMALIGSFLGGFAAERISNRYLLAIGQVGLTLTMIWVLLISNPWQALIYGGALGCSSGFLMSVNNVIWPNYYGRKNLGSIRGIATTVTIGSAALGPLPFAFLIELTDSFTKVVIIFLLLPITCLFASLLAKKPIKFD